MLPKRSRTTPPLPPAPPLQPPFELVARTSANVYFVHFLLFHVLASVTSYKGKLSFAALLSLARLNPIHTN